MRDVQIMGPEVYGSYTDGRVFRPDDEIDNLKRRVDELQKRLDQLSCKDKV